MAFDGTGTVVSYSHIDVVLMSLRNYLL